MVVERVVALVPWFAGYALILLVIYALVYFTINQKRYSAIPGPSPWPLIGNFLEIRPYLMGPLTIQDCFLKWTMKYGSTFKFWVGNKPWIVVSDPDDVKEVLCGNHFPKDPTYYSPIGTLYGQRFAGGGSAIQTNTEKHAKQQKITMMAYHKKYLTRSSTAIKSVMGRWVEQLGHYDSWVPLCSELDKLATSCICKIAFDMDVAFSHKGGSEVYKCIDSCFEGIKDVLFNPIGTLNYSRVEKIRSAAKSLRDIGEDFIRNTYTKMNTGSPLPDAMFSYVLQEIQEAGGSFTLEEIIDEFIVQIVAGTETTSSLMKFLLMEVTRHPHVYERLQAEVDEVMSRSTAYTFHQDLNQLRYLDQVISETLRMYPVAVATTRTNPRATHLGKTLVPARSTIMVCWYTLHRNPKYFVEPNKFDPDRWGPDKPGPLPFTYLPFSSGPRACAGKHIAKMEAKIITSLLLYHYDLTAHPDMRYEVSATISAKPSHPLQFKLTSRNRSRDIFGGNV